MQFMQTIPNPKTILSMITTIQQLLINYGDKIFFILLIIVGALLLSLIFEVVFKSWMKRTPTNRARTLISVFLNVIRAIIFITAILLILSIVNVNVTPLLASAGILGLAVGFGSQVLIKDIISGIFFILENQFNEGDTIQIDKVEGRVEHIGLRTTTLREQNTGALHIFPNGSIDKIANLTDRWSSVNVLITVPAKNDVDKVDQVLKQTAEDIAAIDEMKDHFYEPIEVQALDDLDGGKMTFRVIIKTHPGKQENVAQKFRYLVKENFDKAKISLA